MLKKRMLKQSNFILVSHILLANASETVMHLLRRFKNTLKTMLPTFGRIFW